MMMILVPWLLYALFVRLVAVEYERRAKVHEKQVGVWLAIWAISTFGLLVYFSVYPVGIAGMVWVAVNIGLILPEMRQRAEETPALCEKLMRAAFSMALLSALFLVVGWPLTVLRPETEPYKFIAIVVAGIASVVFTLAIVAAWRRWRSHHEQSG